MKIVMELEAGDCKSTGEDVRNLKNKGIASATLLHDSWEEYLNTDVSFKQLCLMLQAYCLIFPIRDMAGSPAQSLSFAHDADTTKFLVPSKLPDCKLDDLPCNNYTFYFDFQGFLPVEIFNRFVCLMLAIKSLESYELSATCCKFYEFNGPNWQLKVESGHKLKVSVVYVQQLYYIYLHPTL